MKTLTDGILTTVMLMSIDDQIQTLKRRTLTQEGYSGSLPDMEAQWLRSEPGVTGDALPELWMSYLLLQPSDSLPDKQASWLRGLGHLQSNLPEQFHAYWLNRSLQP